MPWGRIDDSLYDHPKLDALGKNRLACVGLSTLAQSWCNRWLTDGHVPTDRVRKLGGTIALADTLVEAGMWETAEGGYQIHDFLDYNDSRDTVLAQREAARERMRNKRRGSGDVQPNVTRSSDEVREPRGRVSRPVPSLPDPAVPLAPPEWDEPEGEALTWLAQNKVYVRPGTPMHQKLVKLVELRGVNAVIGAFHRMKRAGAVDDRGFIFGAQDSLNPVPKAGELEREDRAEDNRRKHEAELARTRKIIAEHERLVAS